MSSADSDLRQSFPVDDTVKLREMSSGPAASLSNGTTSGNRTGLDRNGREDYSVGDLTSPGVDQHGTGTVNPSTKKNSTNVSNARKYVVVAILFFVNLLNYTDRYILAGVLPRVKKYFDVHDTEGGLLQTVFILTFLVFSPIFGYLGDRYNRKVIMIVGIAIWSGITLAGSFVTEKYFGVFLLMRGLVGIGEASYVTVAPTILSDMFVGSMRSYMLAVFYFAIPVGSGLGFIAGSQAAIFADNLDPVKTDAAYYSHWAWSFRVTPVLGALCVVLMIIFVFDPPRGEAEGTAHVSNTSMKSDVMALLRNKSFMLSTWGNTCVAFIAGALALFAPTLIEDKYRSMGYDKQSAEVQNAALIFGGITVGAGIAGVSFGSLLSTMLTPLTRQADPLICACGLLACGPLLYLVFVIANYNMIGMWVVTFFAQVALSLNWSLVADILLYVVIPTRRSLAEALQITISHLFGDAISPYIVGTVKDALQRDMTYPLHLSSFVAMSHSLFMCCFVAVLGGAFFLVTSLFIEKDRTRVDQIVKGNAPLPISRTAAASAASRPTHPVDDPDSAPLLGDDDDDDFGDDCSQREQAELETARKLAGHQELTDRSGAYNAAYSGPVSEGDTNVKL